MPIELNQLLQKVEKLAKQSTVIAICGSAPQGVDKAYFTKLIQVAKANCDQVHCGYIRAFTKSGY